MKIQYLSLLKSFTSIANSCAEFSSRRFQQRGLFQSALKLLLVPSTVSLLAAIASQPAYALTGGVSVTAITPFAPLDANNSCAAGPRAMYIQVNVQNTSGGTLTGLSANLNSFSNSAFTLDAGESPVRYIGTLAAGQTASLYWYVNYPCQTGSFSGNGPTTNYTVTLSDSTVGTVNSSLLTLTTRSEISAQAGGDILSASVGNGAVAGQILQYTVNYDFGNPANSADAIIQPAGNVSFDSSCFRLIGANITSSTFSAGPTTTNNNRLYFTGVASTRPSNQLTVVYSFIALCTGRSTTAKPYADLTSGTQVKYTGNYEAAVGGIFPVATNPFTITKSASPTFLPAGGTATYTVTISNTSSFNAVLDRITDTLPPGVTYGALVTGTGNTSTTISNNSSSQPIAGATGTLNWVGTPYTSYSVPANSSIILKYTANVSSNPGAYTNSVTGTAGSSTTSPATATVGVGSADLSITKTDGATTAIPGNPITYTITVTNNSGSSTVNSITVTDAVPATILNPTFAPSAGSYNSSTGAWTGLSLAANQSVTLTLNGTVSPTATGNLTNTASVSSSLNDPNTSNNSATDTDTLTPQADLTISKTDGQTSINPGSPTTYTISVTNKGPSTVNNVTVSDAIPASIQNPVFTSSSGSYNSSTGAWTGLNLATGQSATLTLTGTVSPNATGTIINTATVAPPTGTTDPNNSDNSSSDTTTITPTADLSLTKTTSNSTPNVGENVTFTVTLNNAGPSSATGVSVADSLPAGLTFVSATASQGTYSDSTGVWTVGTVASSANATLQVTARVATAGAKTNTAQVSASTQRDPDSTPNNSVATEDDQASVTVTPIVTDLSIVKTDSPDPAIAGNNLTYAIAVTNTGATAANVTMSDPLPSGTTFQSITSPAGWTCTTPAVGSNGTVSCNATSLAVGTSNFTVVVRVAAYTANNTTLSNTATVSSTTSDSNTSNNSSTQSTTIQQSADLRLTKVSTPANPPVGATFDYTITVTNDGPSIATNVRVRDALPLGIGYVLNTPSQGTYDPVVTQVWNVGTLNPGASATLTIRALRNIADVTVNTAEVIGADQADPDSPHNNQVAGEDDQDSVSVPSQSVDLGVTKTVNNATPSVGQNVTFTISVTNPSASTVTATNIGVSDVLPQGLSYQSHTASTGNFNSNTGVWSVPSLAPGTTATLTITAQVTTSGTKTNTVQINNLDQSDPNTNNNTASANLNAATVPPNLILVKRITEVAGTPTSGFNDLTIGAKATDDNNANWPTPLATYLRGLLNGGAVSPGNEVEYTIYFLNNQNPAINVTICDPIPANMTFVTDGYNSASPRPTEAGALPTDTGIALASNASTLPINPTFYLTNANDSDRGRYYPPSDPSTPAACKRVNASGSVTATGAAANTDGAIVVNIVSGTNQLPPATTPGTPANSYGYIRFKTRVK